MRRRFRKGIVIWLLVSSWLLALPNRSLAHSGGMDRFVNGLHFHLNLSTPPRIGAAPIQVKLTNFMGQSIPNAQVWATTTLNTGLRADALGEGNEPARRLLQPGGNPGDYVGTVTFDQPGQWIVNISFMTLNEPQTAGFLVDVPIDPAKPVLVAFLGLNVTIIAWGAALRRKSYAKQKTYAK